MELLQDMAVHGGEDHQTAAIHDEVVIEGELAANVPVPTALFWELMSVLWESVEDIMLELLILLVSLGMLSQVL